MFDTDPIKNEVAKTQTIFPIVCLWESKRAGNYPMTAPKLNQEFIPVFVICKLYGNPVTNEVTITRTRFSHQASNLSTTQ